MHDLKPSQKVTKLFLAHGLVIKRFERQVVVYSIKSESTNLQVFKTVQEARTSYGILYHPLHAVPARLYNE